MSSDYEIARAAWLQLEQLAAMAPNADGKCRHCGEPAAAAALCGRCRDARIALYHRFGGRTEAKPARRRTFTAEREEWTPYPKDREERQ